MMCSSLLSLVARGCIAAIQNSSFLIHIRLPQFICFFLQTVLWLSGSMLCSFTHSWRCFCRFKWRQKKDRQPSEHLAVNIVLYWWQPLWYKDSIGWSYLGGRTFAMVSWNLKSGSRDSGNSAENWASDRKLLAWGERERQKAFVRNDTTTVSF